MRQDFLPPEFNEIAHLVNYVHRKSHNEFSGSCPTCGGDKHKSGEDPDRFVMFIVGRYGFPLAFCRKCGYRWTSKTGKTPSKEDVAEWRARQIEVEKSRIESAKRSLEILQNDKVWESFHLQNNDFSREVYRSRGISDSWIDYIKLGLVPDYTMKYKDSDDWKEYHSPAFSIPVWGVGGVVQNIKLRLANPRDPRDRYRNLYPMGSSFLFVPLYDLPLSGTGVLVEGEFKAIVMEQTLDNINLRVMGLQTKTPAPEIFEQMKDLEVIYVALDPDAFVKEKGNRESAVDYCVRMIGKERARIVEFPCKPDDGIIQGMNPMQYIRMSKKP